MADEEIDNTGESGEKSFFARITDSVTETFIGHTDEEIESNDESSAMPENLSVGSKTSRVNVGRSPLVTSAASAGGGRGLVDTDVLDKLMLTLNEEATPDVQNFLDTYGKLLKAQPPQQAFAGAMAIVEIDKGDISAFIERKKERLKQEMKTYLKAIDTNREVDLQHCNQRRETCTAEFQSVQQQLDELNGKRKKLQAQLDSLETEAANISSTADQSKEIFLATVKEAEKRLSDESQRLLN